jgi:hypothetical protein
MTNSRSQRIIAVLVAFLILLWVAYVLAPVSRPKARASRISSVNHVASVYLTIPSTNALPSNITNK